MSDEGGESKCRFFIIKNRNELKWKQELFVEQNESESGNEKEN